MWSHSPQEWTASHSGGFAIKVGVKKAFLHNPASPLKFKNSTKPVKITVGKYYG
jgi:hypothetical protein